MFRLFFTKAKLYKSKYSQNIENYLDNYSSFVFAIYETETNKGFVHSKNSFAADYNTVQFGFDILKNYNEFMEMIRGKVNVIYENIDAILITEEDFNKLKQEGFIGNQLGKFKIEHIFNSFEYLSPRHWRGISEDGEITTRGKW